MSGAVRFKLNWDIVCCGQLLEPAAALLLPEHPLLSSSPSQAVQLLQDPPSPGTDVLEDQTNQTDPSFSQSWMCPCSR